ncbi:MAG: IS4 family transposase [Hyphomicrobiaceae bacterium]
MRHYNSLFHQLLQRVPWDRFAAAVDRHGADARVRRLSTKSQLVALLHAQLSGASSLREIEAALSSHSARLYHLGVKAPARSTLADANAKRPAAVFNVLFVELVKLAHPGLRRMTRDAVHLIDSTSLRLSDLSADWASRRADDIAVKAHVDYSADGGVPTHFAITPCRANDITVAKAWAIAPGETYVFDLGYYDFAWFSKLHVSGCRFVTRLKDNTRPRLIEARAVAAGSPIRADRIVAIENRLRSARGRSNPLSGIPLREVVVVIQTGKTLRILSNDLEAPAEAIAELYKTRWQIELFFRWIKQHLKIKRFLGTSENAVRIQIAVALIAFVLLRLASEAVRATTDLTTFARLVRANLMHRRPLDRLDKPPPTPLHDPRQHELYLC